MTFTKLDQADLDSPRREFPTVASELSLPFWFAGFFCASTSRVTINQSVAINQSTAKIHFKNIGIHFQLWNFNFSGQFEILTLAIRLKVYRDRSIHDWQLRTNDQYSWIAQELQVGTSLGPRWDDVITWSDFRSETILDSSAQTTRDNVLDFFCKPKNGLVWSVFASFCFLLVFLN